MWDWSSIGRVRIVGGIGKFVVNMCMLWRLSLDLVGFEVCTLFREFLFRWLAYVTQWGKQATPSIPTATIQHQCQNG